MWKVEDKPYETYNIKIMKLKGTVQKYLSFCYMNTGLHSFLSF